MDWRALSLGDKVGASREAPAVCVRLNGGRFSICSLVCMSGASEGRG